MVVDDCSAYVKLLYDVPQRDEFPPKNCYLAALFNYEREVNPGRTAIALYIPTY